MRRFYGVMLCVMMFLSGQAVEAKNDHALKDKGQKHEMKMHDKNEYEDEDKGARASRSGMAATLNLLLGAEKKESVRSYLQERQRGKCPPGLAKKRNGCLPPGQAKKYQIGGRLPSDHGTVPQRLLEMLGAPPEGSFYTMVDDDVVLASRATMLVLDAISGN